MDNQQGESVPQWANALLEQVSYLNLVVREMQNQKKEDTPTPLSNRTEATTEAAAEAQVTVKPTKHLGPLATYEGKREELESWISQAQAKLQVDYCGCSEATKFFMVHNQLRGEASRQLQPWVQVVTNTELMTAQGLIDQLRLSFGDPHTKEKAQRKLHKLKQANKPFMEYFTEYRKLVLEAGGSYWPDEIKKSYLEAGLSVELQRCMIGKSIDSGSFEDYCNELKQASDQLEAFTLRNKNTWRSSNMQLRGPTTGESSTERNTADKMDWEPTKTIRTNRTTTEANGRRATWVSPETIAYRREKKLCLRCGNQGHMLKDCKFLPAQRPLSTNKASTSDCAKFDPSLALPEEEAQGGHSSSEESGKE